MSITLALVATGLVLLMLEVTVNMMILAWLVMALVVILDDAIVGAWGTVENSGGQPTERAGLGPRGMRQRDPSTGRFVKSVPLHHTTVGIVDSALGLRSVAIYSALIVAAALLPVAAMEGEAGAFLEPIALAYLLAVAVALVVSLTVAPALSVFLLMNVPAKRREAPMSVRLRERYRGFALRLVPKTGRVLGMFGVFILAGLVAIPFLNQSLRPSLKERDVLVQLQAAPGTSLPRMNEITAQMAGDLRSLPGVTNAGAHVGRAIMSDRIVNVNSAEIWLNIDPAADYEATFDEIVSVVDGHAEAVSRVQTYSDQRITAILDQPHDELVVRVYGENSEVRQAMAEQVQGIMARVDGIDSPRIDAPIEEPTIEIEVDLQRAQAFGVKPGDVRRQATTLVSGIVVGNLFEDQKVYDVVVWGVPEIRGTVDDVRTLSIATPSGDQVPLGVLADVRVVPNPSVVRHESVASYVDVIARVDGRSLVGVAADVDERLAELQFPLEHHVEVLGGFADQQAARSRVIAIGVAALIGVYLLLQAAFVSWRLATLAFLGLPLGISGSLIGVALTGGQVTLGSVAGMVAVLGLATRGVVLLIRSYQRRERLGEAFSEDLVISETTHLVVPSVVSAGAIAVVFLPLAMTGSRAGLELAGPMAVAVLAGLVTTLLLTLVVMPALYLRWGYVAEPDHSAQDLVTPALPEAVST